MQALRPAALLLAAAVAAGVLSGCTSGSDNPTIQGSPTPTASASGTPTTTATPAPATTTATHTATPSPTAARSPSTPTPTKAAVGAYTTIQSAETYAQSKSDQAGGTFDFIGAECRNRDDYGKGFRGENSESWDKRKTARSFCGERGDGSAFFDGPGLFGERNVSAPRRSQDA